jgi:hypothetical protein
MEHLYIRFAVLLTQTPTPIPVIAVSRRLNDRKLTEQDIKGDKPLIRHWAD